MDSLPDEARVTPDEGDLRPKVGRISATEALEFLDPVLAGFDRGVDLVRLLLDPGYETDPVVLAGPNEFVAVERVAYHHLQPQLAAGIEKGWIVVTDAVRESIEASALGSAMRTLALERLAIEVAGILSSDDVEFLVLKGVATGRLDHADPVSRQTSDLDVLVRTQQFAKAIAVLVESGYERRSDPDLLDKGEAWESSAGVVDVHTRPHAAGRFLDEYWWQTSDPLPIAGHDFRALSRAGRMAHAASHYSVSYPNHRMLTSLLDLLTIARLAHNEDRDGASRFLAEIGVGDITARITSRAAALMGDDRVILGNEGARPLDAMLRRAYDRPDLDLPAIKLAKTFGMPWNEKIGAIRRLVAPTDAFLEKGGYTSRADRLATLIGRRWGRSDEREDRR